MGKYIAVLWMLASPVYASSSDNFASAVSPLFLTYSDSLSILHIALDTPKTDTGLHWADSVEYEVTPQGWFHRRMRSHFFALDEISRGRQVPYRENFALMDFNRVTGYFLGL